MESVTRNVKKTLKHCGKHAVKTPQYGMACTTLALFFVARASRYMCVW